MRKINEVLSEALREVRPSAAEETSVNRQVKRVLSALSKVPDASPVLGGSGAKGTWLHGIHDADIFVKFNCRKYSGKSNIISDILAKYLKKKFRSVLRLHGSRDYFQVQQNGFTFEIVPILGITRASQAENITDVSPLHASWVLKRRKLADDMRLAKAFCIANGIYGAESYIRGFSGYVLEILIAYYGSFINLLRASRKWKPKQVIDIARHHKDVFMEVNKSKLESPIIVIDPVQPGRNAAAALSSEKCTSFIALAGSFLKSPSISYFRAREFSLDSIRRSHNSKNLVILEAMPESAKEDVAGCQLLSLFENISTQLIRNGFKPVGSAWHWNKKSPACLYFVFDKKPLPKGRVLEGPPLSAVHHAAAFRKKHGKVFVKGNRLFAMVKRQFITPNSLIIALIADASIAGRLKSIRVIR